VNLLAPEPDPDDPERLEREAARTAERLRTLSLVRLGVALPDGRTRAAAAVALAGELADAAADLAGRPRRNLPELPEGAAGDVLAVCALDLAEEVRARGPSVAAAAACRAAVEGLVALRRQL
jgi:hypothetical protein